MKKCMSIIALIVMVGCPGPGQELRAQRSPQGRPFRPAPGPPAPQIEGPDTVPPYHLGRYRVGQEWPFYQWRIEPSADADVQPIGSGNAVDIVAKPGKYKITLTVGGRRGKSQDVTKNVEFIGENPTDARPPDPGGNPDPGDNPPPVQPVDPGDNPPPVPPIPDVPGALDNHNPIRNPTLY